MTPEPEAPSPAAAGAEAPQPAPGFDFSLHFNMGQPAQLGGGTAQGPHRQHQVHLGTGAAGVQVVSHPRVPYQRRRRQHGSGGGGGASGGPPRQRAAARRCGGGGNQQTLHGFAQPQPRGASDAAEPWGGGPDGDGPGFEAQVLGDGGGGSGGGGTYRQRRQGSSGGRVRSGPQSLYLGGCAEDRLPGEHGIELGSEEEFSQGESLPALFSVCIGYIRASCPAGAVGAILTAVLGFSC